MTITRDSLARAAREGTGIDHLTPGQAWAAHSLTLAPAMLATPLASHIAVLLDSLEQKARRNFFGSTSHPEDTEGMVQAAYDEQHPMFLRGPILEKLQEGFAEHFPGLKPSGVDEAGQPLFHLADLAHALNASEQDLLAHAEDAGFADQLRTTPPNQLH